LKYLLKNVVLLVIGLLAAQPVLSSLNCAAWMARTCAPGCPMAMTSMGPDCPMLSITDAEGCSQKCCTQVEALLPRTSADKSKTTIQVPVAALAGVLQADRLEIPAVEAGDRRADSPPLYILNRVFRI
jgi:hypothetical protein